MNKSKWFLLIIMTLIISSVSFAAPFVTDTNTGAWSAPASTALSLGQTFPFKGNHTEYNIKNVTIHTGGTPTRCNITSLAGTLIETSTIKSGDVFIMGNTYAYQNKTSYRIECNNDGANYNWVGFTWNNPTTGININFTNSSYSGTTHVLPDTAYLIEAITTKGIDLNYIKIGYQNITDTNWNTPTINLTWNASNAQNGTMTLYRNGIINQTIFYQPIGINSTQITNIFLIGDNLTYNLYLQNETFNLTQNSSIIQIQPPKINYINILNISSIWKQNLSANYSETAQNVSYYYWRINNSIVKYSTDFNISDYTNSYLGKNITFCINSTVPSQNYTLENCSSNIFTIGQMINFTAKRIYDSLQIQNFTVCHSLGCRNTTISYLEIYNYNISDTYFLNTVSYQNLNVTLNANVTYQNYVYYPFDAQSIYFSILNMQGQPINQLSTISIYGNYFNYNLTTLNGYANISLLYPDTYKITVSSLGYNTNDFYFNIIANTYNTKTIYLSNSTLTTQMRFNVFEQISGAKLEGYKIIAQYFINSTWNTVTECTTNDQGYCYLNLLKYNFYKFYVYSNINTITPIKIIPVEAANYANDERNILINLKNNVLDEYNFYDKLTLIDFSYTNVSRNFTFRGEFSYGSPITSVCIHVYRNTIQGQNVTYCRTCTSLSPATIFCNANLLDNYTYYANLYDITSNQTFNLQQYTLQFNDTRSKFSFIGTFFTLLIVLVGALLGLPDVAKSLAGCLLGLTLSSFVGFISLPFGVIIVLIIIAIITLVRPRGSGAP